MERFGLAGRSPNFAGPAFGLVGGGGAGVAGIPFEELVLSSYTSGLLTFLPLEADILDASASGNDGVSSSGITYTSDAPSGFNATESAAFTNSSVVKLDSGSGADYTNLAQFTVSCWFKVTGAGSGTNTAGGADGWSGSSIIPLVAKCKGESEASNKDGNWLLGVSAADGWLGGDFEHIEADSPNNHKIEGATDVDDGEWHHGAITFDGADWAIHLDGVTETTLTPGFTPRSDSIQHAAIGAMHTSAGARTGGFTGNIAGVCIWDHALAESDLTALYAAGIGGVALPPIPVAPDPEPEWFFNGADFGAIDNGTDFDAWILDALGTYVDADGVHLVDSTADRAAIQISGLSPSTDYWLRLDVTGGTAGMGNIRLMAQGNDSATIGEAAAPTTDYNFGVGVQSTILKVRTDATTGTHRMSFRHASADARGDEIQFTVSLFGAADPPSLSPTVVLGDRTGGYTAAAGDAVDSLVASLASDQIVAVGDLAGTGASEDYDDLNDTLAASLGGVGKIWPNTGNHDYDHTPTSAEGLLSYFPHVASASPGSGDLATYYSKVIGNVEFFFVDDNAENTDNAGSGNEAAQRADTMGVWLLGALAASPAPWKVVLLHHPPRSSSSSSTDHTNWAWDWGDLGVALVLQGHKHSIELQDWSAERDGCAYYTVGRGGSNHHGWGTIDAETVWREEDTSVSGALKIWDGADVLTLEYWSTDDELLHRYTIEENPAFV